MTPACVACIEMVGDIVTLGLDEPVGSNAFASPKSSTFTVPSARTLMFAGFRSRWMMPCSCAASRASAICFAMGSASSSRHGAARQPLRQILALDEFHHEGRDAVGVLQPVDGRDVRMIQRGEDLRFALEPRHSFRRQPRTPRAGS